MHGSAAPRATPKPRPESTHLETTMGSGSEPARCSPARRALGRDELPLLGLQDDASTSSATRLSASEECRLSVGGEKAPHWARLADNRLEPRRGALRC